MFAHTDDTNEKYVGSESCHKAHAAAVGRLLTITSTTRDHNDISAYNALSSGGIVTSTNSIVETQKRRDRRLFARTAVLEHLQSRGRPCNEK